MYLENKTKEKLVTNINLHTVCKYEYTRMYKYLIEVI